MPLAFENELTRTVTLRTSAVTELVWVLLWLQHGPPHKLPSPIEALQPFPPELVRRCETFWSDGCRVYTEALVLADAGGHLFDDDPEPFFDELERRLPKLAELRLSSETAADRRVILERLRRLRTDPQLRRRYVLLLRDTWALVATPWRQDALPAIAARAASLRERLDRASDPVDVLPKLGQAEPALAELVREAFRRGEAVVAPCYFAGWYLVLDLPDVFLVATQVDPDWRRGSRRQEMEPVAAGLRVLADPTRLAMLAHLAERPVSVTELVGLLGLAQPTVSTHMRLLREAGLVRPQRDGARTDYAVDRDRLDDLLRPLAAVVPPSA